MNLNYSLDFVSISIFFSCGRCCCKKNWNEIQTNRMEASINLDNRIQLTLFHGNATVKRNKLVLIPWLNERNEKKKHRLNRSQTMARTHTHNWARRRVNRKCAMSCRNIKINWLPGLFHYEEPKIICVYPTDMIFTLCVYQWMTGKLTFVRFHSRFSFFIFSFSHRCFLRAAACFRFNEQKMICLDCVSSNLIKSKANMNKIEAMRNATVWVNANKKIPT